MALLWLSQFCALPYYTVSVYLISITISEISWNKRYSSSSFMLCPYLQHLALCLTQSWSTIDICWINFKFTLSSTASLRLINHIADGMLTLLSIAAPKGANSSSVMVGAIEGKIFFIKGFLQSKPTRETSICCRIFSPVYSIHLVATYLIG